MMVHMDEVDDLRARLAQAEEETDAALEAASMLAKAAKVQEERAEAAEDAIARVKALHRESDRMSNGTTVCVRDASAYPCATIRALEGATDE